LMPQLSFRMVDTSHMYACKDQKYIVQIVFQTTSLRGPL
jgi:hypothetical protein